MVAALINGRAGSMTLSTPAAPNAATSRPLHSGQDTAKARQEAAAEDGRAALGDAARPRIHAEPREHAKKGRVDNPDRVVDRQQLRLSLEDRRVDGARHEPHDDEEQDGDGKPHGDGAP